MALDGKLLARAKERLDLRRRENELEYAHRTEEIYAAVPKVREIDGMMRSTVMDAIGFALSGGNDPVKAVEDVAELNLELQRERDAALVSAGYPCDYIDLSYICPDCRDTGYKGNELCSCLLELYREEQKSSLASLLRLGTESFDSFDLTLYDDRADPATGISPRAGMEIVYNT